MPHNVSGSMILKEHGFRDGISRVDLHWTTDGANVESHTTRINGTLERVTFIPNTGSGIQPADNYDIVLEDEDGFDVFEANGANLDEATIKVVLAVEASTPGAGHMHHVALCGIHTLKVTNAGASGEANQGIVRLYFSRQ